MDLYVDAAPSDFQRRVRKALKCWHETQPKGGLLDDLLIAQELASCKPMTRRQCTNLLLEHGLETLNDVNPVDADLLRLRFCNEVCVQDTRQQMHYAASTIYSKQTRAIASLAAVLHRLETIERKKRAARLEGGLNMPPPVPLVGVGAQVTELCALLTKQRGPWLISIEGTGGIGKTALAGTVLRQLAHTSTYAGIGWVSAKARMLDLCGEEHSCLHFANTSAEIIAQLAYELLPAGDIPASAPGGATISALRVLLQQSPYVIVIDNIESVVDLEELLPLLHSLANPSKFILTTRRRLIAERGLWLHCVPELSCADSLALMRQALQTQNLLPALAWDDQELVSIYDAVGGNPLALLVVLGQTHSRPLHVVLADLAHVRTRPIETLFNFILRHTWADLAEDEQRVLATIPLAETHGWSAEEIGERNGLNVASTTSALQHLVQASLLSANSDLDCCHFRLHNLTRTFLSTAALHRSV